VDDNVVASARRTKVPAALTEYLNEIKVDQNQQFIFFRFGLKFKPKKG
jgi:hypothetical protein